MRKINTSDVFNALRLIQKAGIKEKLIPYVEEFAKKEESIEKVGITTVLTFAEIMTENKSEQLIYEVLAGPFESGAKDIADMDLDELTGCLEKLGEENDLRRFFTVLANLITKK